MKPVEHSLAKGDFRTGEQSGSQQTKSIRFIVNPIAGTKKRKNIQELIRSAINPRRFTVEICLTGHAGHAAELSRDAVAEGVDVVVAVGGDGTVNEVATPMIQSDTVLGIVPLGSGNGLARQLGIPLSPTGALKLINRSKITAIDTAIVNGVPFVSMAGVGFDALVVKKYASQGKRGFFAYLHIVTRAYPRYKPGKYKLIFEDGRQIKTRAFFISFANSGQFGYNTVIAPQAGLDDGLLDVCIVQKPEVFHLPSIANLLLWKRLDRSPLVRIVRSSSLVVKRKGQRRVNIDGEAVKMKKKLEVRVNPLSLKVIVP